MTSARRWQTVTAKAARSSPLLVIMAALGVFVALVPSRPPGAVGTFGPGDPLAPGSAPGDVRTGRFGRSTASASSASGGSAPATGPGTGADGAKLDCTRQSLLNLPTCRPPRFVGYNGGATYAGVTDKEIRLVFYRPTRGEQVDALLAVAGTATPAEQRDVLEAYEIALNKHFETYGRHVKLIMQVGPGQQTDAAQQQADAQTAAVENKAFAVVAPSATIALHEELVRRRVPSVSLALTIPEAEMAKRAPYFWTIFPDLDITLDHFAEYYCARLSERNAVYAGDPTYQQSPRRLGVIFPDPGIRPTIGDMLTKKVKARCRANIGRTIGYSGDISTASQQSTNIVAQMKQDGVTTVTCVCDVISPVFITSAATSQAWFPEWIHNGYGLTDTAQGGRLYDQQQWARSFGPSVLGYPDPIAQTPAWKAYWAGKPNGNRDAIRRVAGGVYSVVAPVFRAIEAAGPALDPASLGRGFFSLPPFGGPGNEVGASFGSNGPGPYSYIDDYMEIWWDVERDGVDGKRGAPFYVAAGQRYLLGAWPRTDPIVFRDDGSRQPPRDPDL